LLTSSLHQIGAATGQADHQRGRNRRETLRLTALNRLIRVENRKLTATAAKSTRWNAVGGRRSLPCESVTAVRA